MILAVDIGGTKTLLACFDEHGNLVKSQKFATDQDYKKFITEFEELIKTLGEHEYQAACIAIPGVVDRKHGRGISFGNLRWENVPIEADVEKLINAPVIIENDAKAGGFYEAGIIRNEFKKVLFITVGTGIGIAYIVDNIINETFGDRGGNRLLLEHQGKLVSWESFASGKAILRRFGKKASDITDEKTWATIAHDLALGVLELIALFDTDVIIFGGGVGSNFERFGNKLVTELNKYKTPLMPIPPVRKAKRPEEAVIYGCYELAKTKFGN